MHPLLTLISTDYKEWLKKAVYIAKDNEKGKELLQNFYLHIADRQDKINLKGPVEEYPNYLFKALKNYSSMENKKHYNKYKNEVEYVDEIDLTDEDTQIDEKILFDDFYQHIEDFISHDYRSTSEDNITTKQYKVGLLKLNVLEGLSMTKISQKSGIKRRKVQISIEGIRKIIREKYSEEYEEYKAALKEIRNE